MVPVIRLVQIAALCVAFVVPSPGAGLLDGVPFDSPVEAIAVGLVIPLLCALYWRVFDTAVARALVTTLVVLKIGAIALLTPQGFCAQFRTEQPVVGPVAMIDVGEPSGLMRSWDVRAHWGAGTPECSAITRRDYPSRARFPAWFMNVLDNANQPYGGLHASFRGVVTVGAPGELTFDVGSADATLMVDAQGAQSHDRLLTAKLAPGPHVVELRARLTDGEWRFVPTWNGAELWSSALVTVAPPSRVDYELWRALPLVTTFAAVVFVAFWIAAAVRSSHIDGVSAACIVLVAVTMVLLAGTTLARVAPLMLVPLAATRYARQSRDWRDVMWLTGVPWLAFAAALALPRLDEYTLYSRGDDWLTYQVSAYKIYLQGAWLEAGEKLFYYQPLYRWIAGAWHLVFGDTSGGETLWDASCLLVGSVLAFVVARSSAGGSGAVVAAALALLVPTITPIWYLIGRGLAEISAAGFAWLAALLLIRKRSFGGVLLAGVFAVLAYYTRLNHMLFAGALVVLLLPLRLPASALRTPQRLVRAIDVRFVAAYATVLAAGLTLLAARAWFYGGAFSPFAGTSFGLNHTGLGPTTLFSVEVWRNVAHSLMAQTFVNETVDPRGLLVFAGCGAALLGVLQVPGFVRLPLSACAAVLGGLLGALVAHAHGYPGRFSVHLVPLTIALVVIAVVRLAMVGRISAARMRSGRGGFAPLARERREL